MTSTQKWSSLIFVSLNILYVCSSVDGSRQKRDDANRIIVTTIEEQPYVMVKRKPPTSNSDYEGFIPEMMKYIGDKIPLNFDFKLVEDRSYGMKENNKWTGMIGEMIDGKADMAAAPITISRERAEVVDFTEPFETFGTVLLMLKDKQGSIKSVADLADQTDISYGIVRDGNTENFFKTSNDPAFKKMWQTLKDNLVDSVEKGVENVRNGDGKYAFILESATAEYWVDKAPCNLEMVGDIKVNENSFALALSKGSEDKQKIDDIIKEMKTNGELMKMRKKWKGGSCGRSIVGDTGAGSSLHQLTYTVGAALVSCLLVNIVL